MILLALGEVIVNPDVKMVLFESNDLRLLRVSGDGKLEKISRWNIIGRIIRYFRKDTMDVAVTAKIQEILRSNGINSIKNKLGEVYNIQFLTPERAQALLKNKDIPNPSQFYRRMTNQEPATSNDLHTTIDLAPPGLSQEETFEIKFGNETFKLELEVAKKAPMLCNLIEDTDAHSLHFKPSSKIINAESIQDALLYLINPEELPSDMEQQIRMIATLDYMSVDRDSLPKLQQVANSAKPTGEFILDCWCENRALLNSFERDFLNLDDAIRNANFEGIQTDQARFLWQAVHETNCGEMFRIDKSNDGKGEYEIRLQFNGKNRPTPSQNKGLITLLNLMPKASISIDSTDLKWSPDSSIFKNTKNPVNIHYIDSRVTNRTACYKIIKNSANIRSIWPSGADHYGLSFYGLARALRKTPSHDILLSTIGLYWGDQTRLLNVLSNITSIGTLECDGVSFLIASELDKCPNIKKLKLGFHKDIHADGWYLRNGLLVTLDGIGKLNIEELEITSSLLLIGIENFIGMLSDSAPELKRLVIKGITSSYSPCSASTFLKLIVNNPNLTEINIPAIGVKFADDQESLQRELDELNTAIANHEDIEMGKFKFKVFHSDNKIKVRYEDGVVKDIVST